MNSQEVLIRLYKEKKEWLRSGELVPEVRWTVRGIDLSLQHVRDILRDQKIKENLRKPRISRWLARDLFFAVTIAINYLKNGHRLSAIKTLEKAKNAAQKETQ